MIISFLDAISFMENQVAKPPAIKSRVKKPIHGIRRPAESAIAPKIGAERPISNPTMVKAFDQSVCARASAASSLRPKF